MARARARTPEGFVWDRRDERAVLTCASCGAQATELPGVRDDLVQWAADHQALCPRATPLDPEF